MKIWQQTWVKDTRPLHRKGIDTYLHKDDDGKDTQIQHTHLWRHYFLGFLEVFMRQTDNQRFSLSRVRACQVLKA